MQNFGTTVFDKLAPNRLISNAQSSTKSRSNFNEDTQSAKMIRLNISLTSVPMRSAFSVENLLRSYSGLRRSELLRRFTKHGYLQFQLEHRRRILKSQRPLVLHLKADTSDSELNLEHPVVDRQRKSGKLLKRSASGILLGFCGALVVLTGGLLFSCIVAACSYQVSREFNGLVIQMRHQHRTFAPPISIRELMSVFCLLFPLMNYFYPHGGKSALLLSLAAFILLCMEVLTVKKPKFSQLTAAVFGLFYCGKIKC